MEQLSESLVNHERASRVQKAVHGVGLNSPHKLLKRIREDERLSQTRPRKRRATCPADTEAHSDMPKLTEGDLVIETNSLSPAEFQSRFLPIHSPLLVFVPEPKERPTAKTPADSLSMKLETSAQLSKMELDACFNLVEETSSEAYKNSTVRWRPKAKRREMQDVDMRYILVRRLSQPLDNNNSDQAPHDILGFLSFMITMDDDYMYPVLYVYEVHLSEGLRGCGLGSHLMNVAEKIGQGVGVTKIMLTVFTSNTAAEKFYRRLGYSKDDISPEPRVLRNKTVRPPDYMIMSKSLKDGDDA
ncbi:acyl-CoA N-acyltransferase [Lepidopterella palustris CBS 459.81]|uniref:N-alpha-acetyltransferase 40 n=1 Tax=Lepidopterella palustris CBS 459.81 TaxID=1314670 RepID=A0A8E2JE41_9PEZI|nr:acyl-CoA N-acyltransferase [Lepidopterella palustris CBS 459.81]